MMTIVCRSACGRELESMEAAVQAGWYHLEITKGVAVSAVRSRPA